MEFLHWLKDVNSKDDNANNSNKTGYLKKAAWRDKKGNIVCPGNACPRKCGNNCPIYVYSQAEYYAAAGDYKKAFRLLNKSIGIAADFCDPWNKKGSIYESQRKYKKAYECYNKAHTISPQRPEPIYGLALVSSKLGEFRECLRWCDKYDWIANDHRLDIIRHGARNALIEERILNQG